MRNFILKAHCKIFVFECNYFVTITILEIANLQAMWVTDLHKLLCHKLCDSNPFISSSVEAATFLLWRGNCFEFTVATASSRPAKIKLKKW